MSQSITMPCILRETSDGIRNIRIQDELFQRREIECVGEIDPETVRALILQLRYLQREAPDEEITMYINSPGGQVVSGLALYDVMTGLSFYNYLHRDYVWNSGWNGADSNSWSTIHKDNVVRGEASGQYDSRIHDTSTWNETTHRFDK